MCVKSLSGHTNSVWALQMQGDKLVSGGADSTVRVWDLKKDALSACLYVLKPNVGCVECLQFEGERLVCGSSDSVIKMLNFATTTKNSSALRAPGECGN
jgi:WD40 repeat protein